MKKFLIPFTLVLFFLVFNNKIFALTDYKIREICKNNRKKLTCIRKLKDKRSDLLNGKRIEIQVIPYQK